MLVLTRLPQKQTNYRSPSLVLSNWSKKTNATKLEEYKRTKTINSSQVYLEKTINHKNAKFVLIRLGHNIQTVATRDTGSLRNKIYFKYIN